MVHVDGKWYMEYQVRGETRQHNAQVRIEEVNEALQNPDMRYTCS